jgi:hypothetical protein
MILNSPTVSGSLTVTGNTILSGSINVVGGLTGTASFATTAVSSSYSATATSSSYALASTSSSYALASTSGSYALASTSSSYALASTSSSYALASTSSSYALASTSSSYALASTSASYALASTTASYGLSALSSSNALTASSADTLYVRNNVTALGSITAQTLIVQTVTSSVLFTTGSNKIGSSLSNTQELTGSVGITGSLAVFTNGTEFQVSAGGVNIGNALTDNHIISGSVRINPNGLFVSSSGNVGIGTTAPAFSFEVYKTGTDSTIWGYNIAQLADSTANKTGLRVGTSTSVSGLTNLVAATDSAASQLAFWTYNGSAWGERMRISSAGNVGIGTSSPVSLLSLSSSNPIISLIRSDNASTAAGAINFYATSTLKWQIGTNEISGTAGFEFNFAGTNVALMNTGGSMGFGTNQLVGNVTAAQVTANMTASRSLIAITTGGNYGNVIGSGVEKYLDLSFYGFNNAELARIRSWDESNVATTGTLTFWTLPAGGSVTERMRITSAGNVGIGTSSPGAPLSVVGNSSGYTLYSIGRNNADNASVISFRSNSAATEYAWIESGVNSQLDFGTNGNYRMRITSAGNVGIGTSSPSYTLDVNGSFRASSTSYLGTTTYFTTGVSGAQNYGGSTIRIVGGTGTSAAGIQFGPVDTNTTGARGRIGFLACANNGNPKEFAIIKGVLDSTGANTCNGSLTFHTLNGDNGTEAATRMTIDGNGSIGAPSGANIYNASDIRLKKNISTVSTGLDSIMALNPVKFNWIDNFVPSENGKDILGFIAQEVLEVLPEAVEAFGGNTITVDTTTVDNPLRVNEKYIIPVLVKAIQELKAEIDILKNR